MTITTRKTKSSLIIESDGIDTSYGRNCTVQGAWVGKVSIPRAALEVLIDTATGSQAYQWSPDGVSIERATSGELFAIAASGDFRAPKGTRRYGCRKIK